MRKHSYFILLENASVSESIVLYNNIKRKNNVNTTMMLFESDGRGFCPQNLLLSC